MLRTLPLLAVTCLSLFSLSFQSAPKPLKVHLATWNVNEKKPIGDLEVLLGVDRGSKPDLIAVGLQEVTMAPVKAVLNFIWNQDKWTDKFNSILESKGYVKVGTERLVGIMLNIFVLKEHEKYVHAVETGNEATGLAGVYGNKGGVMAHMTVYGSKLCFVNAHMAAHLEHLEDRIENYRDIDAKRYKVCEPSADHFAFWMGDLNFRVDNPAYSQERVNNMVKKGALNELLAYDQLINAMTRGEAFVGFNEAPIMFNPTFKLIVGTEEYNLKRHPSWTDRILYQAKDKSALTIHEYNSLPGFDTSDHKPVFADLTINV